MTFKKIHEVMVQTLDKDSFCCSTLKKYAVEFKVWQHSRCDSTTDEQVNDIRRIVLDDNVQQIGKSRSISSGSVYTVFLDICCLQDGTPKYWHLNISWKLFTFSDTLSGLLWQFPPQKINSSLNPDSKLPVWIKDAKQSIYTHWFSTRNKFKCISI